ncbi:thiamine pyrophosphate-binding protein [Nocardioides albidus]|uniref:Thiamine pyrophosphate-binding protein n=1 Tax=Nocardioides albidus TaxID=1517589 RepID=A0A5C4WRD9_9ACTN|nr:thiamine pyrophosphate-binding protein [Nocardioides albidus]TNM50840.1 thiamine pyrophosphate-binding protein [Nocardioides albidus]
MTKPTASTAIASALEALGVEVVFAIPSAHNIPILRAIEDRGAIRIIGARHEQGVAHAADAYARTTGSLGVGIVSGGPGTANTMGGMYEAYTSSSPVLLITSQVESAHLGRGRGYVHEAENQAAMLATVCREVVTASATDDLAETVIRLGRAALAGRPRPVALEVPLDLQDAPAQPFDEEALVRRAALPLPRIAADDDQVAAAARLLATAQRPVIWAGGGVLRAEAAEELLALARRWNAPVLTSREGRGAISEDDPLSIGAYATLPPVREFVAGCDVMLAVGTRFQMYATGQWTLPFPEALVHLDVDAAVIGRSYPASVAVVADAKAGLTQLAAALPPADDAPGRAEHVAAGRSAAAAARDLVARQAGPDHLRMSRVIAQHRPADGVLVCDATVPAFVWGDRLVPITVPRTSVRSVAAGIGPGMALALGAAAGSTAHTVLLQGDGGFMLGIGELASAVQARSRIVVCLFDDGGYGMLRDIQATSGLGLSAGFDLATPDFAAVATAFGARSARVKDAVGFEDAFAEALSYDGPTLIHVDLAAMEPLRRTLGA